MKYKIEDFNPKNNKTVCLSAWSHLHASTDGKVYNFCMDSNDIQVKYFKYQTEFYDNVRGENFREIFPELKDMVNAKIV